jgi:PAS domain S-box-containing protein
MERLSTPQLHTIFERMVNLVDEGVLIVDPNREDMPIIFANNGFTKITGYETSEVIGKNPRFLKGPETDTNAANMIRTSLTNKKNGTVNILNYKKDGSIFWNHFSVTPIIDNLGNVTHWIGIERDITPIMEIIQSKSKEHSMVVTIHTINDIINNFLNSLFFFRQAMEDHPNYDNELLVEFDNVYKVFMEEFQRLSNIEKYKEKKLSDDFSVLDLE